MTSRSTAIDRLDGPSLGATDDPDQTQPIVTGHPDASAELQRVAQTALILPRSFRNNIDAIGRLYSDLELNFEPVVFYVGSPDALITGFGPRHRRFMRELKESGATLTSVVLTPPPCVDLTDFRRVNHMARVAALVETSLTSGMLRRGVKMTAETYAACSGNKILRIKAGPNTASYMARVEHAMNTGVSWWPFSAPTGVNA
jgi:hypothetical protein